MRPLTRFDALCDMTEQGLEVYPKSAYESMADKLTARTMSAYALHHIDGTHNNDPANLEIVETGDHINA